MVVEIFGPQRRNTVRRVDEFQRSRRRHHNFQFEPIRVKCHRREGLVRIVGAHNVGDAAIEQDDRKRPQKGVKGWHRAGGLACWRGAEGVFANLSFCHHGVAGPRRTTSISGRGAGCIPAPRKNPGWGG